MRQIVFIFCIIFSVAALSNESSNVDPDTGNELSFGKQAADEYVLNRTNRLTSPEEPRFIGILGGHTFYSSASNWGDMQCSDRCSGIGGYQIGLIYGSRMNWKSVDLMWKAVVNFYNLKDEYKPISFSVKPNLVFPELKSKVPIYVGVGAGVGTFTRQAAPTSALSVDVDTFVGLRAMNVLGSLGLFAEVGWQTKIFLLSERGRFRSGYATVGTGLNF